MSGEPFPTNHAASIVDRGIDGVFKVAVNLAEAGIIAEVPLLANPILEKIDNAIIEYIANKIYRQFALFVTFEVIDFQTGHEVSEEKKALIALKLAQKAGNQDAIANALADFQKACVNLTHIDGAANPGNL